MTVNPKWAKLKSIESRERGRRKEERWVKRFGMEVLSEEKRVIRGRVYTK